MNARGVNGFGRLTGKSGRTPFAQAMHNLCAGAVRSVENKCGVRSEIAWVAGLMILPCGGVWQRFSSTTLLEK